MCYFAKIYSLTCSIVYNGLSHDISFKHSFYFIGIYTLWIFGVRKSMFSSHLAEFLWRYEHKGKDLFETFLIDVKIIYGNF